MMNKLLYTLFLTFICHSAFSTQMEGFGRHYYENEHAKNGIETTKNLTPEIIIGNNHITFEVTSLDDIKKLSKAPIKKDEFSTWICLHSKSMNFWFVSDNEMGGGYLTAVILSKGAREKSCKRYNKHIFVSLAGTPLVGSKFDDVKSFYEKINNTASTLYYKETPTGDSYTRNNTIEYYFQNKEVNGAIFGQVTTN